MRADCEWESGDARSQLVECTVENPGSTVTKEKDDHFCSKRPTCQAVVWSIAFTFLAIVVAVLVYKVMVVMDGFKQPRAVRSCSADNISTLALGACDSCAGADAFVVFEHTTSQQ